MSVSHKNVHFGVSRWLGATLTVVVATVVATLTQRLSHANLSLVFLCAVLVVAALWGRWPSIYASLLSFMVFNVLFTAPLLTLRVADDGDVATLLFFLAIAALAGHIAARARTQMELRREGLRRMERLFDFTRRMSAAAAPGAVARVLAAELSREFDARVAVVTDGDDGDGVSWAPADAPDREPALRCARNLRDGGAATGGWHGLALTVAGRALGAVCLDRAPLFEDRIQLAHTLCDQAAVALERMRLASDLAEARVDSETEKLRSALLASVSHDLRTPLAAITGSASSLLELGDRVHARDRRELLEGVLGEAGRLDRYIQNLLDMTRLGHGSISLRREWVDLGDVARAAAERLGAVLPRERILIDVAADAALVNAHGALLEQTFVNLLDNAARFSPPDAPVRLEIRREAGNVIADVVDSGPGIAPEERTMVFDMFYRVRSGDRSARGTGTGLGLAICRGMVGAHGGHMEVLAGDEGRGTCMRIVLPAQPPDAGGAT